MDNQILFKNDKVSRDFTIDRNRIIICKNMKEFKFCKYGDNCKFSHDLSKLNFNNDNNICPKVTTNLKICRNFEKYGNCKFGDNCKFSHISNNNNINNQSNNNINNQSNNEKNTIKIDFKNKQEIINKDSETSFPTLVKSTNNNLKNTCWGTSNSKVKQSSGVIELNKNERTKANLLKNKNVDQNNENENEKIDDFFDEDDDDINEDNYEYTSYYDDNL